MYYIKKLILRTKEGSTSEIEFTEGLNIIYGESNTGKSLVVNCIDYLYGASEHRFDEKLEIDKLSLVLDVNQSEVILSRSVGGNAIEVSSTNPKIQAGTYKVKAENGSISEFWLSLLNIKPGTKIVKTQSGGIQNLTFRTFSHIFTVDEDRIISQKSILANNSSRSDKPDFPTYSALLYLATEKSYAPEQPGKSPQTRKERKEAVQKFVKRSLVQLESNKEVERRALLDKKPEELQKELDQIINNLASAKGELTENTKKWNDLSKSIIEINKEVNELNVLFNRNEILKKQYISDIGRLGFVVEGEMQEREIPELKRCPFCNSDLENKEHESCIDAAVAESRRIRLQVEDLLSVQKSIRYEIDELVSQKELINKLLAETETKINRELEPKIEELKQKLTDYSNALKHSKAMEMIENFGAVLTNELKITEDEESKNLNIKIKDYFNDEIGEQLSEELNNLLKECRYHNFVNAYYDESTGDVIVNGHEKKKQGKGYRAFLNTIMVMAIQNTLHKLDGHTLSVIVLDSPILSLKEKEDDDVRVTDTMKTGLFKHLVDYQKNDQIIIIENEIPKIDYKNTNLIEFTKDPHNGRYGLITEYRE